MLELTNVQHDLFVLLRHSLGKNHDTLSDSFDWDAVYKEADNHMVQPAVSTAILELTEDKAITDLANKKFGLSYRTNLRISYTIETLDNLMRNSSFPYMILKGAAAAVWYPEPMNRILGDVDFLINPDQKDEVSALIEENNYHMLNHADENDHHIAYVGPGARLEMHFEIPGIPDGESGEKVRRYMADALSEAVEMDLSGKGIMMPKPEHHGLIILLHMQHHMLSEGIGLRHLMDLAVFAERTGHDSFWNEKLIPLLKSIGLFRYTQVMVKTGSVYLGTYCPEWAAEADDELCDDVMNDILAGGNFGRVDKARAKSGMMLDKKGKKGKDEKRHGRIYNLYATLHESTLVYWPQLKKHKVIWFFADCFRVGKYICQTIVGKRPSIIKAGSYAKKRRSVYDRLGIFDPE